MAGKTRKVLKAILFPFLGRFYNFHMRSERLVKIDELRLHVSKEVFHPGFFFSSRFLKGALSQFNLNSKSLLDIGSGSGVLSISAAKQGADVTAIDIAAAAIEATLNNAILNETDLKVIKTDLWDNLYPKPFDFIVINPPYYPDIPEEEAQFAWYCGPNFEYFTKLFQDLKNYTHNETKVLMILSEDCQIDQIKAIAKKFSLDMKLHSTPKNFWETNYIFNIKPKDQQNQSKAAD